MHSELSNGIKALGITMVLCRNPVTGKFLTVQEKNKSWWIPGGRVDAPQTFCQAGVRECKEETGIDIEVKGVLRMELSDYGSFIRLKSILYGEPKDASQIPKLEPDEESIQGKYMSLQQILALKEEWRDHSIYVWPRYLSQGGKVYPLSMLKQTIQQ